ncbi:uncharacterized protein LOC128733485 isoform X2 [Sabethes cyaneus]|uniref:uncharacterized protein LOC128733485 isoform X2 n=1 Tax=Sabethes cyaneus TaxID=53552 RepID=UPI00237EDEA1|nr:uncharacterized protein LOC128733485 isoform X2 [Sabethes cyaneus]
MLYANNSTSILMCGMDSVEKLQCNTGTKLGSKSAMDCEVEPEKGDLSPENSKKSDSSPLGTQDAGCPTGEQQCLDKKKMLQGNCCFDSATGEGSVNKSVSLHEIKRNERSASEDLEVRNALAFTIDFGDGRKSVDTQRHEKMLERFQNRHKRGVSLSKLEGDSQVTSTGKMKTPQSVNLPRRNKYNPSENSNAEVKLRDKSKARKDSASKRHSWSPRTSMTESGAKEPVRQVKSSGKFVPKSAALQIAFEHQNAMKDSCSSSEFNAESLDSSIGLLCVEPPLENFKNEDNDDSVSEAGTYTLDGDNYTEEQKERMNIDRMPTISQESNVLFTSGPSIVHPPKRPTCFQDELEVIDLERPSSGKINERRKNNILEVAFFHDPTSVPPLKAKQSYLEKLKSRVKNITHKSKSPEKHIPVQHMNSPDQGTFTSVTTSGILSIKPTLQNTPLVLRRNSLTKSHIDSSEYVQGISKLNIHKNEEDKILNCYTDSEKANVLSDYNAHHDNQRHQTNSDASAISSVVSKKDWIQEWAKNAREYSKKPTPTNCSNVNIDTQMTRSFNSENRNQFGYDFDIDMTKSDYYDAKKYDEFGDNLDRQHLHRKQLERLLNHTSSSSSDPSLKQACGAEAGFNEFTRRGSIRQYTAPNAAKPPMSPSKIPSPIGSVGRARSVSRNRSLQGSNSDLSTNETEMYLQKTAAAISTLQNLHRRNSMRASSVQNSSQSSPLSPASRRISPKISPMNSLQSPVHNFYQDKHHNEGPAYSPQHQQIRHLKHQQQQQNILNHKRNLSLDDSESYVNALSQVNFGNQMNNSFHTDNINAILDFKKQHTRHNSFEGMAALPPKPLKCFQNYDQPTAYYTTKGNDNRNEMKYNVDDDDDDDEDEQLIVVTSGFENLSVNAKHNNIPLAKQFSKPQASRNPPLVSKTPQSGANRTSINKPTPVQMSSPIKRSSSFSVKAMKPITPTMTPKVGLKSAGGGTKIQKSASSTSFKKIVANYNDDEDEFYINDDDDLELGPEYSSNSEFSDKDDETAEANKEPITNTRYNKTFLMRMEQNKKIAAGVKHGVAACPNTPELPRRSLQVASGARERASMPRDSSLSRMKQDMHISRKSYKTPGGGNFLKKDESKSYLVKPEVKKSPSSAAVALTRNEPNRISARSARSATPKAPATGKKDTQQKAKEQELEMWRRRASYDPMKAALEGKKKQEEARRQAHQQGERLSKFNESSVLRSQSYHSGVGAGTGRLFHPGNPDDSNSQGSQVSDQWTVESSDDYEDE